MGDSRNAGILPSVFAAFAVAVIIKLFCFDFIIAEGMSMRPAVTNGTMLVVNRLAYGFRPPLFHRYLVRWAVPKPGDVLIFWTPFGDLAVKRCAELIGNGYFFAIGDNGPASFDSRSYGPVPIENIIGRAVGIK